MPTSSKTKKTKSKRTRRSKKVKEPPVEEVAAAAPEEVVLLTPEEETTVDPPVDPPVEETSVDEVVVETVAEPEADPESNTLEVETVSVTDSMMKLNVHLKEIMRLIRVVQKESNEVKRDVQRLEKLNTKLTQKRNKKRRNRQPNTKSGIMKPHKVDPVLEKFMEHAHKLQGLETQEEYSRVDVLKAVSKYVELQGLKETIEGKKKYMNLDKHLRKVFPSFKKKKGDDRLQYTNIMGCIGVYFPPTEAKSKSS